MHNHPPNMKRGWAIVYRVGANGTVWFWIVDVLLQPLRAISCSGSSLFAPSIVMTNQSTTLVLYSGGKSLAVTSNITKVQ